MRHRGSRNQNKEVGIKRGPWTDEEDQKLMAYIQQHGHTNWRALPEKAGLQRCGKSCRLRWINYLKPDIKRGKFSLQEEHNIIQLHALLGNRWSAMAAHLPKRTDNEIKNHWNTHLKKRLIKLGIDPMTHKPRSHTSTLPSGSSKNGSNVSHTAQWESARLEAEARLVRDSKQVVPNIPTRPKNHLTLNSSQLNRPRCLDVLKAWQGVVAGMFGFPGPDLESPVTGLTATSELGFDNILAGMGTSMELDGKNSSKQMQEFEETIMDSDINAWFEDSFSVGNYENADEDAFTLNAPIVCDSVLDLVINSSPLPYGSSVF